MKKIFITGGTGLVGRDVSAFLSDKYEVYAGTIEDEEKIKNCKIIHQDITKRDDLIRVITEINPDYIIHLAALTDVNLCEEKRELARKINIEGTKNVVIAAEKVKARLIYASTNYVFDGKKGRYKEEDAPNPVNFYAFTKLEGEKEVLKYSNSVITRICPFGLGTDKKPSFTAKMIKSLLEQKRMDVFSDQFFSPISTYGYARVLMKILESDFTGIINIAGLERLSRYEFAKRVSEVFNLDSKLLNPIKITDLNETAERPRDTSLDISKAKSLFGDVFFDILSELELMKRKSLEFSRVSKSF
jgi:dTDP-4-dehydrorhamnose reductase